MRKALIAILLLIYSAALFVPVLQTCKPLWQFISHARRVIRQDESHDFLTLSMSKQAYAQLRENEVWHDGTLHDIIAVTIHESSVELMIEADHFETACIMQYAQGKSVGKIPLAPTSQNNYWDWLMKIYASFPAQSKSAFSTSATISIEYCNSLLPVPFIGVEGHPPNRYAA